MNIDHDRISFTYWLIWKNQGKKYYGVKSAKGSHYFDLGTKYKSSSKYVKAFIKDHGEPEYVVDRIFLNAKKAVAHEAGVLKRHDAMNNPEFLNRWNGAGKFTNTGRQHTEEHKLNISKSKKGVPNSEEHKLNISKGRTGITFSEEHKLNMTKSRTGKPKPQTIVECPHCGKTGGKPGMTRYHFDHCKEKGS